MEDRTMYSAMQENKPIATYKKTILAKVCVTVWDHFLNSPETVILHGDPRKNEDSAMVEVFSDQEDNFFKKMNKVHFNTGTIIKFDKPEEVVEHKEEQFSDEQLSAVVNLKYLALVNKLNTLTSIPVVYRMLDIAREEEKSEKITNLIAGRLAELQANETPQPMNSIETEA